MRIALQLGKGHFEVSHPKEKSLFSVKIILLAKRVYIKKPSVGVEEKECLRDRSIRRCITSIIKIIVGLLMNNSFQFVQNSQLNASRSKETHLFSKGQRFRPVKTSNCSQSAYDLSRTMMTSTITPKSSILARDNRFKSSATISPSPNAYNHHAFIDINRSAQRGHSFSLEPKGIDKNRRKIVPGPGSYEQIYNPEKKLSYTMRSKVNHKDYGIKVGPGQYQVENYHAFSKPFQISSKYNNPRNTVMGQAQRFKPRAFETMGPGPNGYGRVKTEMADSTKYSFGRVRKEPSYIRKNSNPGPNYYNRFSEFSQLKNGLPHMQSSRALTYQ